MARPRNFELELALSAVSSAIRHVRLAQEIAVGEQARELGRVASDLADQEHKLKKEVGDVR